MFQLQQPDMLRAIDNQLAKLFLADETVLRIQHRHRTRKGAGTARFPRHHDARVQACERGVGSLIGRYRVLS